MTTRRWSSQVTQKSDSLDLEAGVFTMSDPKQIARSLQASALNSKRRQAEPYQSAMSMLSFYINRAGQNLPDERRQTLEAAKLELRRLFGK
jgi:hypothetical protein